jgi:anthranilate synthase component 1
MSESLQKVREKIDKIDSDILKLLHERFYDLSEIVEYKLKRQLPTYDKSREDTLLEDLTKKAKELGLREGFVHDLYQDILKESRGIQKEIIASREMNKITLKDYPIGSLVPIYQTVRLDTNIDDYFAVLSDFGRKPYSFLLESADIVPRYGEFSLGCVDPCFKIVGKGSQFEIEVLNARGKRFIEYVQPKLDFIDDLTWDGVKMKGSLTPERKIVSEEARLKLKTHMDVLRTLTNAFHPVEKPFGPYAGLFGMFSYDFIDQFEDLPQNEGDLYENPDYYYFYADHLFLADHKAAKLHLIANALITEQSCEGVYEESFDAISAFEQALQKDPPQPKKQTTTSTELQTDTGKEEFVDIVKKCQEHIKAGDVFQIVPSRTVYKECNEEPFAIYKRLKQKNPSPYMAYIHFGEAGQLVGASPEMCLRVQGGAEKTVEIRPIAGTRPRGLNDDGSIDNDLDSRYEMELKLDNKELAEHAMLVDLARNDVARVCKPGTRKVSESVVIEKYSHVQHIVSHVEGILKDQYDAFHAYLASMNMGTLTGAPKVKAMELIRKYEKNRRGFYGGAVGYFTPSGEMDSMITIRTMWTKDGVVYTRAGAGVVYDSVPIKEFEETEKKMRSCLSVLE